MENFFSIITVVNNDEQLKIFKQELGAQTFSDYELLPVLNPQNVYTSAGKALNSGAGGATGKYLIFTHPDIRFESAGELGRLAGLIEKSGEMEDVAVLGAAGAVQEGTRGRRIISSIHHGTGEARVRLSDLPEGRLPEGIEEVQTVDECFFIIRRDYWEQHPFAEREGWHLYCVEYCLDAIRNGQKVTAAAMNLWHLSDGKSLNKDYVAQLCELIKKEKDYFGLIATTVKPWRTRGAGPFIYRKYYYVKQAVKAAVMKGKRP